jgi:hypothetical protein
VRQDSNVSISFAAAGGGRGTICEYILAGVPGRLTQGQTGSLLNNFALVGEEKFNNA